MAFAEWNDPPPRSMEADLVAHCGVTKCHTTPRDCSVNALSGRRVCKWRALQVSWNASQAVRLGRHLLTVRSPYLVFE